MSSMIKTEEMIDRLRNLRDREYCAYIDKMLKKDCRGFKQKLKEGIFGAVQLQAHNDASEMLGKHRAYDAAIEIIQNIR